MWVGKRVKQNDVIGETRFSNEEIGFKSNRGYLCTKMTNLFLKYIG
jgi:hypothetical protein